MTTLLSAITNAKKGSGSRWIKEGTHKFIVQELNFKREGKTINKNAYGVRLYVEASTDPHEIGQSVSLLLEPTHPTRGSIHAKIQLAFMAALLSVTDEEHDNPDIAQMCEDWEGALKRLKAQPFRGMRVGCEATVKCDKDGVPNAKGYLDLKFIRLSNTADQRDQGRGIIEAVIKKDEPQDEVDPEYDARMAARDAAAAAALAKAKAEAAKTPEDDLPF